MKVDLDQVLSITETALTIRGSRRRVTVPSEVVENLNLKDGDKLRWIVYKDNSVFVHKVNTE
jgi:bifunctional DNA-binding transcriptional regulator/antitoxin component of YhaV-PrlF toxin-antitoxin module